MRRASKRLAGGITGAALAAGLLVAASPAAADDSCREWRLEHRGWKAEALRRYLRGAPEREVDAAVFELLQREAYLTSCEISVEGGRDDLVGWRLVGRTPDEYGRAVAESVLGRAGFDLSLHSLFEPPPAPLAAAPSPRSSGRWKQRGVGAR
jgi:hypothetical protein